jgi:cytochrome c oxidase subunit 3
MNGRAQASPGWSNQKLGLVLFIASEGILFGALFANYFYNRANSRYWPPESDVERVPVFPLALILTVVLLSSGWTCHNAVRAISNGRRSEMLAWLAATILLGSFFIGGQAFEYANLFQEGLTPGSGLYATTFFGLTGMHGAHVLAGIALLSVMYLRSAAGHFTPSRHFGLEGATLYWHFVDLVWVVLFFAVYLF